SSSFKTTGLLQPWQTLCKIFCKCLKTRVTGWDQPPLQIMQMMYCFINNIHVDYADLLWRVRDRYHNLKDNDIMKNIFNSGRHKDRVGMKIPDWMISEEMKHTEHYWMYAEVFGIDVPLTQRSTRLTPPALVPTVDKVDEMILQDTLQVSLAEHKSREEQEARENVELVNKHLASVEIEKMVRARSDKESLEVEITNNEEVEITNVVIPMNVNEEEEEITDEVYELKRREKGKIVEDSRNTPFLTPIRSPRIHTDLVSSDIEKLQELTITDTTPTPSSSNLNTKLSTINRLLSLFKAKPSRFKLYMSFFQELQGRYGYLFEHLRSKFFLRKSFDTLIDHIQEVMVELLPTMVDKYIKEQVKKQVPEQVPQTTCRSSVIRLRDQDDPHDDSHPKGENSAKRQKTSEYEAHVTKGSSGQVNEKEQGQSSSRNQEQTDDYDFWTESYALDDDELLTKQVSQDIIEEVSLTINEAELKKIANEMLRQRCTLGDEHQYHIDQMKYFLKSDIIIQVIKTYWELGHEHKFITQIVARRDNECIVSITEPDYKNLNKNDTEDMYLLIMNGKVPDYAETGLLWSLSVFIKSLVIRERVHDFQLGIESYQQKVNLTAPTISFLGIEKHKMFSIIYEPMHGIIYKNSKKEKRAMRHSEIHKFCDATLNIVLKGLKSYNNDVKYGYIQRDLIEDEVEYLNFFVEKIEVRLKYRN
ncbi:hypothetical protein Tco_1380556, partial [Tanacetum coccineum]